jgi:DNA-binding MarR family transcriptional regulator
MNPVIGKLNLKNSLNTVDDVLIALRRIIRSIDLHSRKLAYSCGLTVPQFIVMREIERRKNVPVGELARGVNLSHATVTDILGRLEKRSIIARTRSGTDKRRVNVMLTEEGRNLLKNAPPLLHEKFTAEFNKLKDYEQTLILSSLQRMADLMDVKKIKVAPILSNEPVTVSGDAMAENEGMENVERDSKTGGPKEYDRE